MAHSSRLAIILSVLFILTPLASANVLADPGSPEVQNNICSTWNSTSGICDDYNFADDATPSQEWIEGNYHISMANTSVMQLTMEWAVREVNRTDIQLEDLPLGNSSDAALDGIPADYIRNYLDYMTPSGVTVRNALLAEVTSTVTSLINNGFGQTSNSQTIYVDSVTLGDAQVQCTSDPDEDSADEVAGLPNDAYNPPLCLRTTLDVVIDPAQIGLTNAGFDVERAYQGLLTMGATVRTDMNLTALPGHYSIFKFVPPNYATLVDIGAGGQTITENSGGYDYDYGRWTLDHLQAANGADWLNQSTSVTMARRTTITRPVELDLANDRGISLDVTIDATDELAATMTMTLSIHHIGADSLSDWGWTFVDERVDIPWVTSDGLRLAHHTGLANISEFANLIPVDAANEVLANNSPTNITISEFTFLPADDLGGLDFQHVPGVTCAESASSPWCIQGSSAMNGTWPIYLGASTDLFELDIIGVVENLVDDAGVDMGGFNISLLTDTDIHSLLNAVKVSGTLDTDILTSWISQDLPPADVTVNIILPSWISSTEGDSRVVTIHHVTGESGNVTLGATGAQPYDWRHPICASSGPCAENSDDRICSRDSRTCVAVNVEVDFTELEIHEWDKSIQLRGTSSAEVLIHRIAVPSDTTADIDEIEIEAVPSDLIRRILDIGERMDGGLAGGIDDNLSLPLWGEEHAFEVSRSGVNSLVDSLVAAVQDELDLAIADIESMNQDDVPIEVSVSSVTLDAWVDGLELYPGTAMDDRRPIRIVVETSQIIIDVKYTGEGLSELQGGANAAGLAVFSFAAAMHNSALSPYAAEGGMSGIEIPRNGEVIEFDVPAPAEEFDGEIFSPAVTVTATFPRGLGFAQFDSRLDRATLSEAGGRQTLVYRVPVCDEATLEECESQTDHISVSVVIGIDYFLGELAPYILGIAGLILLLIMLRLRRRRGKAQMLHSAKNKQKKLRLSEADLAGDSMYSGDDNLPSMAALAENEAELWDEKDIAGYEDLLAFDDDL